ncbi:MAG: hypothetical protein PUB20_01660 [Clostridia bacterium]|nr:hypothetical protein [Clostridia bacterium]
MKKLTSIIMSLVIGLSFCLSAAAEGYQKEEIYPTIMIPGYAAAGMYYEDENGDKIQVWAPTLDLLSNVAGGHGDIIIEGLVKFFKGDPSKLAEVVGNGAVELLEYLRCNPDGTPVYDLHLYCDTVEKTQASWLIENMDGNYIYERDTAELIASQIGVNGMDYIYNFNCDFRQNIIDCAADLDKYIDEVLEYSGAEKVNLYAVSHGGQITATYLNLYGQSDRDKLNNVILTVPAIGGSSIPVDFFTEDDLEFDEMELLRFVEYANVIEEDLSWLVSDEWLGIVDGFITNIRAYLFDGIMYWGSLWDFVPSNEYERLRDLRLDSEKSAALIAKSDYFHNVVYPDMWTKLQDCIDSGINVYIIAGSDCNDLAGYDINSDGIISVASSTGAKVAPYGMRFNDGYKTANTNCSDSSHNHLSPSMAIDLSAGYLPEQTWISSGAYHGMTYFSDYNQQLIVTLITSDELVSVHTYEQFPQFYCGDNVSQAVGAWFNNSANGYVSGSDTELVIKNCSKKYDIKLISIGVDGMNIDFDCNVGLTVPAGETVSIPFSGNIPGVSLTTAKITVNYASVGSPTPLGERTFDFTIMNGPSAQYDDSTPFVSSDKVNDSVLDSILGFISSLGIQKFVTLIYNMMKALIANIF